MRVRRDAVALGDAVDGRSLELADTTQRGEPFSASDGVLLRLAARHTARNVAALADGPPQLGPAYAASLQATLSKLDTVVRRAHEHITAATV